jgi:CTP-dependent riboflavin kinase
VKKKGLIKGSKLFRLSAQELVEIEEELGMEPYQGAFPVYLTPEEQKVAKKLGFIQEGE